MAYTDFSLVPWIGLAISFVTLLFTFLKFGREVHVDDRRNMLRELDDCRRRCEQITKEHQDLMMEHQRLREENHRLYQRLLNLNGGHTPERKGK